MSTKIERSDAVIATKYKMTTDIPASVTTPDAVETRLGTLRFFDGFPDEATIQALYDHLDFQRAVQAYLQSLPAVQILGYGNGLLQCGPANRTAVVWEDRMDSHTVGIEGNANTVYWSVRLDTHEGPLVLEVPAQVYGTFNDAWVRWVVDLGVTGPDRGQGGKYLLLPPGYSGEIPDGYFVVRPLTFNLLAMFRTLLVNDDPKPGVERGKAQLRCYLLAEAAHPPQMSFVNLSGKPHNMIAPCDVSAFEYLNRVVQEEPIEAIDPNTLGLFASIGIQKGQPFAPDERMQAILAEAAAVGNGMARAITYRYRDQSVYSYPNSAWRPYYPAGYRNERDGVRQWDAFISVYFQGGLGVSPAGEIKMVGKGSQYVQAFVDAHGEHLDGGKTYKLHLPGPVPAKDFWSVLVYDTQTRSMLQTDQRLPMTGSQIPGLQVNPDMSVDVYFAPEPPAGHETNWVQTIPGKGWMPILRLYGPLEPWFDKTWKPGEFELVD